MLKLPYCFGYRNLKFFVNRCYRGRGWTYFWSKLRIWVYYPLCWNSKVGRSTRMHCIYQNLDNIYLFGVHGFPIWKEYLWLTWLRCYFIMGFIEELCGEFLPVINLFFYPRMSALVPPRQTKTRVAQLENWVCS